MEEQGKFLEIVEELKGIAKSQGNRLSKEEIQQYLSDMGLSEEQFTAVYQYLGANRITVEGYRYIPLSSDKPLAGQKAAKQPSAGQEAVLQQSAGQALAKQPPAGQVSAKQPSANRTPKKLSPEKKGSTGAQAERNRMLYHRELAALGTQEEAVLHQRMQEYLEGNLSLRNEIVEAQLKNVVEQVAKYRKKNVPEEDIIAEGNLALLNEIHLIEENREQFRRNDGTVDVAAFKRALEDGVIHAMESFIDEVTLYKDREETILARVNLLHEATKYLAEEYGRMPTEEELSEYTRIDSQEIRDIRGLSKEL